MAEINTIIKNATFNEWSEDQQKWKEYHFKDSGKQVECEDGMTVEEKIGNLKGITDRTDMTVRGYALDSIVGADHEKRITQNEKDIRDLKEASKKHEEKLTQLDELTKEHSEDISKLKEKVKTNTDNIYVHEQRLETDEEDISNLKGEVVKIKSDLLELENKKSNNLFTKKYYQDYTIASGEGKAIMFDTDLEGYNKIGVVSHSSDNYDVMIANVETNMVSIRNFYGKELSGKVMIEVLYSKQ